MIPIRRGTSADAAKLAEFARRTFYETFVGTAPENDMELFLSKTYGEAQQLAELQDPGVITLIAEEGGAFAGFAQLRPGEGELEVNRFYVDRSFQGRGLAQALMREAEAIAIAQGARRMWLGVWEKNHRALAFYAKCGFRDCGSHEFVVGTDVQTDRLMEKVIRP